MITMDIFNDNAFSATSMTAALDKAEYIPQYLSSLPGLIVTVPVRTTSIFIEEKANAPALILTTPRGAPPKQRGGDKRKARGFETVRIAQQSTIYAHEIQSLRAFGSETDLATVQAEVAQRQIKMLEDYALTRENMLLGLVQGKTVDADGSVIYDWGTEFSQSPIAEIDFDLDAASPVEGVIRKKCNDLVRKVTRNLKGLGGTNVRVNSIVGDNFWDDFTNHSEVIKTYLNYEAAANLRGDALGPWKSFSYGGITWHNYRGTDDNAKVAVDSDKAKFFPVGAGIFQWALSPAETFDFVNTMGKEFYSWIVMDKDRNAWAAPEIYSYPLPVCTMPSALGSGKRT